MASKSQLKASRTHRQRAAARGLVRLEVQTLQPDVELIKAMTNALRGEPARAAALRSALARALEDPDPQTAFDVFGSDLPDAAFDQVFDQPRQRSWRQVDL